MTLEGLFASLIVATLFALFWGGEPNVPMQPIDYVGWYAILGIMGMLNSLTPHEINEALARRLNSWESDLR